MRSLNGTDSSTITFDVNPSVIWFTGLSGAGKTTSAIELQRALQQGWGIDAFLLDGDQLRRGLCKDLGFSPEDRAENIRRAAEVAKLLVGAGHLVLATFISPSRQDRAWVRDCIGAAAFVEVHVQADLAICEARDPKGIYARCRAGRLSGLSGLDSPYEAPLSADIVLDTGSQSVAECRQELLERLLTLGVLSQRAPPQAEQESASIYKDLGSQAGYALSSAPP